MVKTSKIGNRRDEATRRIKIDDNRVYYPVLNQWDRFIFNNNASEKPLSRISYYS
jgi:hypothetical protein